MRPYSGFSAEPTRTTEPLPAGGYVARILKAEEVTYDYGSRLIISFDIEEGEHKGHFANNYKAQNGEDKRWKGVLRQSIPKDDGSEKDGWSKRSFNNLIWAIEDSNPGYHWDWNEVALKGKLIGVLFRNKEWEMNGKTGWTTECSSTTSVENIRAGKFRVPADKPLANKSATNSFEFTPVSTADELPF